MTDNRTQTSDKWTPNGDRERPRRKRTQVHTGKEIVPYDPHEALEIVTQVAEGELLRDITGAKAGRVSKHTFLKWVALYPDLRKAYEAAKSVSALSLEEEAIATARETALVPGSSQHVAAATLLVKQLQWSASKRDPKTYGEKSQTGMIVPVQINTTLNLGQEGAKGQAEMQSVGDMFSVSVPLKGQEPVDAEYEELPAEDVLREKLENAQPLVIKPPRQGNYDPRGPRKRVLTPRIPMDEDTREAVRRQKEVKRIKKSLREGEMGDE